MYGLGDEIADLRAEVKVLKRALDWLASGRPRDCGTCPVFAGPGCCREKGCQNSLVERAIAEARK